jgi:hypothetical protein
MPNRRSERLEKVIEPILIAREGFIGLHNPDAMIGKFVMRPRQVDPGHMAGHAFVFSDRTGLGAGFSTPVTGQAFGIKIHFLRVVEVVVRVVAGQAADARVVRVIAFAPGQPVGLEADVGNTGVRLRRYLRPRTVTLTAEIGGLFRRETNQLVQVLWWRRVVIAGHYCGQVRVDSLMTVTALHSWTQFVQSELLSLHRISRMAAKAAQLFIHVD